MNVSVIPWHVQRFAPNLRQIDSLRLTGLNNK